MPENNRVQRQLELTSTELDRLRDRIWYDFNGARSNHNARIERFRRYYRMWRGLREAPGNIDDGQDFEVPMLKWITFGHWSRVMAALLGDDAEIVAAAKTPEGQKLARKVGLYETWRWFEYMKATPQLSAWMFRTVLFGRAHAECIYDEETYMVRNIQTGKDRKEVAYDGPKLIALWPSELIVPAQDGVDSVNDFYWKIRRKRVTPQQLLDGEEDGIYQGVEDHWDEIFAFSQNRQERDYWWDDEKIDKDSAEGVSYATTMGNRDSVELWEWYGKWNLPTSKRDVREGNLDYRNTKQSELLVKFLPRVNLIVGVEDLRNIYPRSRKRDPFLDIGLVKDGSYWCPGVGEIIEELQRKSTANYKLFERAGIFSVGPMIFYRPSSGFDPDSFEYEPNMTIPTEDPAGVNVVRMQADLDYCEKNQQALSAFAEKVSGVSDQTLGQSIDRPNAPRTASGQIALIEQGNVRASLDMNMIREDLSTAIEWTWLLDREFADDQVFFRATEEEVGGLFDIADGFGQLTAQEREHSFDFQLKFATSVWSKAAKKQEMLAFYQLAMQNPIVATNPRALWTLLNKLAEAMGEENFRDIIPEPPQLDEPKTPKEEWMLALEGEEFHVNPQDDDDQHLLKHRIRMEEQQQKEAKDRSPRAEQSMREHIVEHERQKKQKALLQAEFQRILQTIQQNQQQQQQALVGQPSQPAQIPGAAQPDQQAQPQIEASPALAARIAGPNGLNGVG